MYLLISILIVIAAALLILAVLIQNPKGGGLASNFSSSNQIMGVARTNDMIEKITWGLAIAILVLALVSNVAKPSEASGPTGPGSIMQEQIDNAVAPVQPQPGAPAPADGNNAAPADQGQAPADGAQQQPGGTAPAANPVTPQ